MFGVLSKQKAFPYFVAILLAGSTATADDDLLSQLGSVDPNERQAAQVALFQLDVTELEALAAEVAECPSALPAWEPPLRRALRHAHLRAAMDDYFGEADAPPEEELEPDDVIDELEEIERMLREQQLERLEELQRRQNLPARMQGGRGGPFLGVGSRGPRPGEARSYPMVPPVPGYVVRDLVPGFVASTVLREGDVITRLSVEQPVGFGGQRLNYRIDSYDDLRSLLLTLRAGQPIEVGLLREDQPMTVRLELDRRVETTGEEWLALTDEADRRAETVWRETFARSFDADPLAFSPADAAPEADEPANEAADDATVE